jgi:hypothetical protein
MDFDDDDNTIIFRDGYNPLPAPTLSGPTGYICDEQFTVTLHNVPSLFINEELIDIDITEPYYFSSISYTDTSVTLTPSESMIGKQCSVKFTLSHNGTVEYIRNFIINGPREDLVSISVLDYYGGSPAKYGDTYYLCPNTIYYVYYNNNDNNCTTSGIDWDLPYGWSEYYRYNNFISINTNDYPDGYLEVNAIRDCCDDETARFVRSQYFGAAECGGYFMAFPNPSSDFVDIDINKEKISQSEISTGSNCFLTIVDKTGLIKSKTKFSGFPYRLDTSSLPDGIYFINLQINDKKSTIRLVIKH